MSELIVGKLGLPEELRDYVEVFPWPAIKRFRLDMLRQVAMIKVDEPQSSTGGQLGFS